MHPMVELPKILSYSKFHIVEILEMNRRAFLASVGVTSVATQPSPALARAKARKLPATIALTFDFHPQAATIAADIMRPLGIRGTFYADPAAVGAEGEVSLDNLITLKEDGWEIGAYTSNASGENMVTLWRSNRALALMRLKEIDDGMAALGFEVDTIAPNARAWNRPLANMARGRFKAVRAADVLKDHETYPIADPFYVSKGANQSWGTGGASAGVSDTAANILKRVDALIPSGGMRIEVIHRIGPVGDAYTIVTSEFEAAMKGLADRVSRGVLRVVPFVEALQAPTVGV